MTTLPFAAAGFLVSAVALSSATASAQQPVPDRPAGGNPPPIGTIVPPSSPIMPSSTPVMTGKGGYHLMKPTPREEMRELSTDRPDRTESPYTVDAGHFQVETDLVAYRYDKRDDTNEATREWMINNMNLKAGLTNYTDLQVIVPTWISRKTETGGATSTQSSVGEVSLRLKFNWLGNDGGPVAIGLIPVVELPTSGDGLEPKKVEGGIMLPVAAKLTEEMGLGFMLQANKALNNDEKHYHTEFITTASLGRELLGELGGFVEIYSESSNEQGAPWIATFDTGLIYQIGEDLQLDAGVNLGLTDAAEDVNPFVGVSARW